MPTQFEIFVQNALEIHDPYAQGHGKNVSQLALLLALEYEDGTHQEKIDYPTLQIAANIHDVGKLFVPEIFISKSTRLTISEMETIKLHTVLGYRAVQSMSLPFIAQDVILHHHENWDGTGYPHGLLETNISIYCRIVRIVDSADVMFGANRPYKKRKSVQQIITELEFCSGREYDPYLTAKFVGMLRRKPEILEERYGYTGS